MTPHRPLLPSALLADKPGLSTTTARRKPQPLDALAPKDQGSAVARNGAARKSAAGAPGTDSAAPAADFAQTLAQRLPQAPDAAPSAREPSATVQAPGDTAAWVQAPQTVGLPANAQPATRPDPPRPHAPVADAAVLPAPDAQALPAAPVASLPAPEVERTGAPGHRAGPGGLPARPALAAPPAGPVDDPLAEPGLALEKPVHEPAPGLQPSPPARSAEALAVPDTAPTPAFSPPSAQAQRSTPETPAEPATLHLPQALGSPAWNQALGQQVLFLRQAGLDRAQLQLHPQDLGLLQIELQLDDGKLSAQFHAVHAEVREAVQAALPQLQSALAGQGLSLGQTQVGSGGGDQAGQHPGEHGATPPHRPATDLRAASRSAPLPVLTQPLAPGRLHTWA